MYVSDGVKTDETSRCEIHLPKYSTDHRSGEGVVVVFLAGCRAQSARMIFSTLWIFSVGFFLTVVPVAQVHAQSDRGIAVEPLPVEHTRGNAGLFVGVNRFTDDSSIRPLQYAVNDAVAQARYFVLQLKLIPASNTRLLLSGEPTAAVAPALAELKTAGVAIQVATRSQVLKSLSDIKGWSSRPEDMVIVSLSSHGFEQDGVAYVLPSEALLDNLADTALSLDGVERQLDRAAAQKRLLIVDACRENVRNDRKDLASSPAFSSAFRDVFKESAGRLVLASCDALQLSYEDSGLGHGVFTAKLLEALSGKAGSASSEFVTLGQVLDYLDQGVPDWVQRNRPGLAADRRQRPWFKGPTAARNIPLGISADFRKANAARTARTKEALRQLRLVQLDHAEQFTKPVLDAVESALGSVSSEELLRRIERHFKRPEVDTDDVIDFLNWWKARPRSSTAAPVVTDLLASTISPAPEPPREAAVLISEAVPGMVLGQPLNNTIGTILLPVPAGSFLMGSKTGNGDEEPETRVTITRSFWLGKHEVTQAEYQAVMGVNPSSFKGDVNRPVDTITWDQAVEFCRKLTDRERAAGRINAQQAYRLPTEAEWEYAARAGTTGARHGDLNVIAWWSGNTEGESHPVNQKAANAWGFHDMLGNVWEWCSDRYGAYPGGSMTDPAGPVSGAIRVYRGGSSRNEADTVRSAYRNGGAPSDHFDNLGFRLALSSVW
jgi:formylglycine-generating enzyme required for sulfatase activity